MTKKRIRPLHIEDFSLHYYKGFQVWFTGFHTVYADGIEILPFVEGIESQCVDLWCGGRYIGYLLVKNDNIPLVRQWLKDVAKFVRGVS